MTIKFPDGDQLFRSRLVQTQTASKTSASSTNSTNYSDTGLSKSISISSGNVVLVMVSGNVRCDNSGNSGYHEAEGQLRVMRGSTVLKGQTVGFRNSSAGGKNFFSMISFGFIDSPGAGNHTYKLQFGGGGGTFRIYVADGTHYHAASGGFNPSVDITLFEIDP